MVGSRQVTKVGGWKEWTMVVNKNIDRDDKNLIEKMKEMGMEGYG